MVCHYQRWDQDDNSTQSLLHYGRRFCHLLCPDTELRRERSVPAASPLKSEACSSNGQYVAGQVIQLISAPNLGYQVASWSGTDNDTSKAATNQVTMPAGVRTVTVSYELIPTTCYALTLNSGSNGGVPTANPLKSAACGSNGQYVAGEAIQLTSAPNSGYQVASWSGTDNDTSKAATNQVTMPAGVRTVTVSYELLPTQSSLTCTTLNPKPAMAEFDGSGHKPQSRVWQYNNTWWAVFSTNISGASSAGTWLWKLEGTTWIEVQKLSTSTSVKADVKPLGNNAYILLFNGSGPTSAQLAKVQFSGGIYQAPVISDIFSSLTGSGEVATLDINSTGRMWVSMSNAANGVKVFYSVAPYSTWSGPITLASMNVWDDDTTDLIAMPGINKVGVLWGDQYDRVFRFFVHNDGDDPATWMTETLPYDPALQNLGTGSPTYGVADDHINLAVASNGTLYAAVKTSYDTAGYPKMALYIRHSDGTWDNLYGVDEAGTRPIVLLDEVHGMLTYIYTSSEGYNPIVYQQSPTTTINFPGRTTLRSASFNDSTSMKANYNGEFVVLYSSATEVGGQLCTENYAGGADLSITKSDGKLITHPSENNTYTIAASNSGPQAVSGATVADVLPSTLTGATWTCAASGGASCTASGSGSINDLVNLPVGGSVTYNLSATVSSSANGTLSNTATITPPGGTSDPTPANNSATDTDTITANGTACETDSTLVGCWKMEENGGGVLVDGSSYVNNATVIGSPAWATGKVGGYALDLDGTSQYAVVADNASLDLTDGITIAVWIRPELYGTQDIIVKDTNGGIDGYRLNSCCDQDR